MVVAAALLEAPDPDTHSTSQPLTPRRETPSSCLPYPSNVKLKCFKDWIILKPHVGTL